jgi:hypothetical protein
MREIDARIGMASLVMPDGEPVVVLIGRGARAELLEAAYRKMDVTPIVDVTFDPPVRL